MSPGLATTVGEYLRRDRVKWPNQIGRRSIASWGEMVSAWTCIPKLPGCRHGAASRRWTALKPLPAARYEFCEWNCVTAGSDYEVRGHCDSVPYRFAREARFTSGTVKVYRNRPVSNTYPSR